MNAARWRIGESGAANGRTFSPGTSRYAVGRPNAFWLSGLVIRQ